MSLKNKPTALLASLGNPEFSDIKIEALDGEIGANKTILSITCEYFCRMFSQKNNFRESSTGRVKLPYPKAVVEKMIIYLYSGEMEFGDMGLGQLLDLLEFLNLTNLTGEFKYVESYSVEKIKQRNFPFAECLNNLEKSSMMRMEAVGETLMTYLDSYMHRWCELKEVGELSEAMVIRLNRAYSGQAIYRFRTILTWLAANPQAPDQKKKFREMFDLNQFSVKHLASVVRTSGLFSADKIIARMEEVLREQQESFDVDIDNLEKALDHQEEVLGKKVNDISHLERILMGKNFAIDYLKKEKNVEIDKLKRKLKEKEVDIEKMENKLKSTQRQLMRIIVIDQIRKTRKERFPMKI